MDQVSNAVLNLLQEITKIQQPIKEAQKDTKFEDLMAQHRQDKKAESKPEEKPADQVSDKKEDLEAAGERPTEEQEVTWREQMVMAAMAIQPVTVVPVEAVEAEAVVPAAAAQEQVSQAAVPVVNTEVATQEQQPKSVAPETQQPQAEIQETGTPVEAKAAPVETETVSDTASQTKVAESKPVVRDEADQELEVKVTDVPQERVFGEVEAVPVKVGETMEAAPEEKAESVEKQVMEPLAKALERGDSKVEIQLKPAHLGSLTIELTRHADGTLHVLLSAENPKTLSLLDKHVVNLQSTLFQQNQEPVRVEVQHQQSQHNPDYQQEQGQHGRQQEQRHQQSQQDSQDFLQQLRLGLTPLDSETV